jgi:hypothetical protein
VRELPLGNRNVLDLLAGMAGTGATEGDLDGYFAGNRLSAVNVTLDGMSVSTGRYDQGTLGTAYMSPDLVEEVRVTTGTVDAERGRGSGQRGAGDRRGPVRDRRARSRTVVIEATRDALVIKERGWTLARVAPKSD